MTTQMQARASHAPTRTGDDGAFLITGEGTQRAAQGGRTTTGMIAAPREDADRASQTRSIVSKSIFHAAGQMMENGEPASLGFT